MADEALDIEDNAAPDLSSKTPEVGKPLTEDEAVDSIADLLGGDPAKPEPKAKPIEEDEDASKDPLGDDEEDVVTDKGDDNADGSEKATAGKYVSASAKYKLADGTEITVGDLARNNLFQRDYSQKTEALKRDKDAFETRAKEVDQLSRTTSEERQYLIWFAENFAPKPPAAPALSAAEDPIGHLTYNEELRKYGAFAESYRQFRTKADEEAQRKTGETQQQANQRAAQEVSALMGKLKLDPQKDAPKVKAFFEAIEQGAQEHYGLSSNQIADLIKSNHIGALVLRDAIRYRKGKSAVPKVQEQLKQVPRMTARPTARTPVNQQAVRARAQTAERLQKSGSMRDGIAAIEALIS
jgi:hypothetical protein